MSLGVPENSTDLGKGLYIWDVCTKYPHLLDLESFQKPPEAAVPWVLQCETPCCDQQHSFLVENHKVGGAERQQESVAHTNPKESYMM